MGRMHLLREGIDIFLKVLIKNKLYLHLYILQSFFFYSIFKKKRTSVAHLGNTKYHKEAI